MKRFLKKTLPLLVFGLFCNCAFAQRIAIRTNLLDYATLSPNLALETRLNRHLTLSLGFAGNPFQFKIADTRFNNLRFQPELRYWFSRPMARHYMGVALLGCMYDLRHKEEIYQGDIVAAGLTYGYALVLSRHWNVEFTAGIGIGKTRYFKYNDSEIKPSSPNFSKWTPVPMNIGVSFSYIFK